MKRFILLSTLSLFVANNILASEQRYDEPQKTGYLKFEVVDFRNNNLSSKKTEGTKEELNKERKSNLRIAEKRLGLKKKKSKVRKK